MIMAELINSVRCNTYAMNLLFDALASSVYSIADAQPLFIKGHLFLATCMAVLLTWNCAGLKTQTILLCVCSKQDNL